MELRICPLGHSRQLTKRFEYAPILNPIRNITGKNRASVVIIPLELFVLIIIIAVRVATNMNNFTVVQLLDCTAPYK